MADNYIDKIQALRRKAEDAAATEAEALEAMAFADKLMQKHQVTEAQLARAAVDDSMRKGGHENRLKTMHPAIKYCLVSVSKFCEVKCWYGERRGSFFGFHADVEMAEYLMDMIRGSMERGWKEYLASNRSYDSSSRHTEYWSFHLGFGRAIQETVLALIKARTPIVMSSGTDLVLKKMEMVEAGFSGVGIRLTAARRGKGIRTSGDALGSGRAAGGRVSMARPVAGKGSVLGIR